MINFEYFCLPALYVKDISSDVIHMVGTDAHDRLYLDANGNIQYLNLQSGGGTPDDYSFVLDEDGHNQNNLLEHSVIWLQCRKDGEILRHLDIYLQNVCMILKNICLNRAVGVFY